MTSVAAELVSRVLGSRTALACDFLEADRAEANHLHVDDCCWCAMQCDGEAIMIDSWDPPGVFCRGHYPYWERWGAPDPGTAPLAALGPDGVWRAVASTWRLGS